MFFTEKSRFMQLIYYWVKAVFRNRISALLQTLYPSMSLSLKNDIDLSSSEPYLIKSLTTDPIFLFLVMFFFFLTGSLIRFLAPSKSLSYQWKMMWKKLKVITQSRTLFQIWAPSLEPVAWHFHSVARICLRPVFRNLWGRYPLGPILAYPGRPWSDVLDLLEELEAKNAPNVKDSRAVFRYFVNE